MQAVEEYIAQHEEDTEAHAAGAAETHDAQPQTVPHPRRTATGAMVMPSPSLRANASIAANSYQEAFASSLRSHGFSVE